HDPLVRSQVLYPAELQPLSLKLYTYFQACRKVFQKFQIPRAASGLQPHEKPDSKHMHMR
ncbi:hypothetical protein, partial [Comamonas testosteroni]|uniref:hypothetical protein n=1 Tax=Comamonas testosteroni TaxID=285 RepID=UPI001E48DBA3